MDWITIPAASQPRRIVSIAEVEDILVAVADDGISWYLDRSWTKWTQLLALPDREAK